MARKTTTSGSPTGEPEYLVVGFLRRTHGVHGEMIMDVHTDFPERLKPGRKLWIGERRLPAKLASVRALQGGLLVSLQGIESPEIAGRYRNQWVYVDKSTVPPLPAGQLYKHQLVGMSVVDESGQLLGKIDEIVETGANDVYVVRQDSGAELLLPAIPSVILEIDQQASTVRVHLLDGLQPPPARRRGEKQP